MLPMLMDKDKLTVFAKINGVGSASGLFLNQDLLYIIGDNSAYLYQYNVKNKHLVKIKILASKAGSELIPKINKPDFEVLCNYKQVLYIMGSGSTPNRNLMIEFHLETKKIIRHDLTALYTRIKKKCLIDDDNLNIEGAIYTGDHWFLLNRGNGKLLKNGIIKISGRNLETATQITFKSLALLKANQLVASFTDAVLHAGQIYFIAAAEDTRSTYDDGEILGSYIGGIDVETLQLNFTKKIADHQKFEGITFLKEVNDKIEFLICEDKDSDILETIIYKLVI